MAETPTPAWRKLRIFALDPSLGSSLRTFESRMATVPVRYECDPKGVSTLRVGPVGEYLEVVDIDPASNRFYAPVNLDDPRLLVQDGLEPSEGNPQFHQQMVYAVAMRTIEVFEEALGRKVLWAPTVPAPNAPNKEMIYVPRLRLFPHALRTKNAYYSPDRRAILFGYFPSEAARNAATPGGTMVFSCLSGDIIAHEMTHALLDGAARGYRAGSNPDVLAFHEGFADIVALFQHYRYRDLVHSEIAQAKGTVSATNLLGGLAKQFGEAAQRGGPLRDYAKFDETISYRKTMGVHARGSLLVKAIYDAFTAIVERRTAGLIGLATGGSGILKPGALHPDLVEKLTDETCRAARHVMRMCIRAIDYCPPVDIDFGSYLRALMTADLTQVDEDRFNYRTAFLESFRKLDLLPENLRTVSIETLKLPMPPKNDPDPNILTRTPSWLAEAVRILRIKWRKDLPRQKVFADGEQRRLDLHRFLKAEISKKPEIAKQLGINARTPKYDDDFVKNVAWEQANAGDKGATCFQVASVRAAQRVKPNGSISEEIIVVITQRHPFPSDMPAFFFLGGVTLVIDPHNATNKPEILHAIYRRMDDSARQERECDFRNAASASDLRAVYFGNTELEAREPFAIVHRHGDA